MPFSQIFPPSPSPTESIRLFYTSVSLLLSRTQGYCYHLSKFHIYVLVYCILLLKVHFSKWVSIKYAVIKSSFIKRTFWSNPRMLITQRIPETGCSYNKSITKGLATGASGKEPVLPMQETPEMQVQSLGRKDLWRKIWQPTPVFLPGEFHGQRSLAGYSP